MAPFQLSCTPIVAADAQPGSWLLVLHGIFGSGTNWRTFARKLVDNRRDWGVMLVDLRMHGDSQNAPPPHCIDSAAEDISALVHMMASEDKVVRAISGHSFGGKVALCYRGMKPDTLAQTWLLDSSPSGRNDAFDDPSNTVVAVLDMLDAMPHSFAARQDFIDEVTRQGKPKQLAQWLAMNLEHSAGSYTFRLHLDAMRQLLASYYATDLWHLVGGDQDGELHVVAAGDSSALSQHDKSRMRRTSLDLAQVHIYELPNAGHWVHIDALPQLLKLFGDRLPSETSRYH